MPPLSQHSLLSAILMCDNTGLPYRFDRRISDIIDDNDGDNNGTSNQLSAMTPSRKGYFSGLLCLKCIFLQLTGNMERSNTSYGKGCSTSY